MKNKIVMIAATVGTLLVGLTAINTSQQNSNTYKKQDVKAATVESSSKNSEEKVPQICDGTTVVSNCIQDGISYKSYIYHPAVAEKSHTEQITTYEKKITSYCTLCRDSTYSPSCATGRGACSHHGGVAQWNAPRYSNVPVYNTKTIVDIPAKAEYYEKITQ